MKTRPVILIGNGGHARVLTDILKLQGREIIGFTAPKSEINNYGLAHLGNDDEVFNYDPNEVELINAIGSTSSTIYRKRIFEWFSNQNYNFANVIHPTAIVADTVKLGEGIQIMAGSVIQPFVRIADNIIINTSSTIEHDCQIGSHCHIAPGVTLSGAVVVGNGTHIGTGSSIIQNVRIGQNVLIGAGSLVLGDVSPDKTAYGVPAKEV